MADTESTDVHTAVGQDTQPGQQAPAPGGSESGADLDTAVGQQSAIQQQHCPVQAPAPVRSALAPSEAGRSSDAGAGGIADLQSLVIQYAERIKQQGNEVMERAVQLQVELQSTANLDAIKAQVQPKIEQLQAQVQDLSPTNPKQERLVRTYMYTAAGLVSAGVGSLLGGYVLAGALGLFLSPPLALLGALVAVPAVVLQYNRQQGSASADERSLTLLAGALVMGVLNGYVLSGCYSAGIRPPSFLLPVGLAVACGALGDKLAEDRRMLLGAAIGIPVGIQVALGAVSGSLGLAYVTLATGLAGLYGVATQHIIANQEAEPVPTATVLVACTLATKAALIYMTSYSYEQYQQLAKA